MAKKNSSDAKLSKKERRRRIAELIEPFRVTRGRGFSLRDYDPDDSLEIASKESADEYLRQGVQQLARMQDKLYAQDQWGVLLIFQAMDAAGKDGAIKHVMSGINPQGCQVYAFKAPTSEELDHDFLWRTSKSLPERGRIGIFNRSYYEEALVVRVHPEILAKQKLPSDARHQADLGRALRGHPRLRALPRAPGLRDRQVLPERLAQGAEGRASWSGSSGPRRTGSSRWPTRTSASTGRSTRRPTRT